MRKTCVLRRLPSAADDRRADAKVDLGLFAGLDFHAAHRQRRLAREPQNESPHAPVTGRETLVRHQVLVNPLRRKTLVQLGQDQFAVWLAQAALMGHARQGDGRPARPATRWALWRHWDRRQDPHGRHDRTFRRPEPGPGAKWSLLDSPARWAHWGHLARTIGAIDAAGPSSGRSPTLRRCAAGTNVTNVVAGSLELSPLRDDSPYSDSFSTGSTEEAHTSNPAPKNGPFSSALSLVPSKSPLTNYPKRSASLPAFHANNTPRKDPSCSNSTSASTARQAKRITGAAELR